MTDALRRAGAIRGAKIVDMTCKPVGNGLVGDSYRFEVASKIQAEGVISYSRGVIKILDLAALKAMSCECYETLREQNGH